MMKTSEITDSLRALDRQSQKREIDNMPKGLAAKIIADIETRFPNDADDLIYLLRDRRIEDSPVPR